MQHFQPILIVIGLLAISAVLIHGFLLSRKNRILEEENSPEHEASFHEEGADVFQDELGEVRIISAMPTEDSLSSLDQETDTFVDFPPEDEAPIHFDVPSEDAEIIEFSTGVSSDDVDSDQPIIADAHSEQVEEEQETQESNENKEDALKVDGVNDIFIFNVVSKEESYLRGHQLLQFFLTSGFRYGEKEIFHRHLNSDGTGPILFSIANMMSPGTFNPPKMKQFHCEGVSFFMTAPNQDINIKESFDMMLTAVQQMADEFDCLVLNAERKPLTVDQFREYNERLQHYT